MNEAANAPSAASMLSGGGGKYIPFLTPGTKAVGKVVQVEVTQQTDLDQNLKTWPDGKPMWQLVVTLDTADREDNDDDGQRRIYAKGSLSNPKSMLGAIAAAVKATGEAEVMVGGELAVVYTGDGQPTKPGFNPPKEYTAQYRKPVASVAVGGDFFGDAA